MLLLCFVSKILVLLNQLDIIVWQKIMNIWDSWSSWSTDWTNKLERLDKNKGPGLWQNVRTDLGVIVTLSY